MTHLPCPRCGRRYDDARLEPGRLVHCACGGRVGRPLRTGIAGRPGPPRFLADSMLGRLARWLRTLGYDTAWEARIEDDALVRRGVEEGRWVLTADRGVAEGWRVEGVLLLPAAAPLEQLAVVHREVGLGLGGLFSRCTACNEPLRPAPRERWGELPPAARERADAARECPRCEKLYWRGSHTDRMRRALEGVL